MESNTRIVEVEDDKTEDYFSTDVEQTDDQSVPYTNQANGDAYMPAATRIRKKLLRKEKSRVQFFINGDSTHIASRSNDKPQRMEDSPADSVKSEYSGTDLRKFYLIFIWFHAI